MNKQYTDKNIIVHTYTPVAGLHDDYGRHEKYFIGIKK